MKRLIVLRPEPGSSVTVRRAQEMGLDAVAVPLFRIESVSWNAPEPASFDGMLLTSAKAVRHAGDQLQQLRGLRAYCVGAATAEAAREAGFDIASVGNSGVDRLLGSIEENLRLLHLAGEDRTDVKKARQEVTPFIVYRACELEPAEIDKANGAVVMVHSARAAERFAAIAREPRLDRSKIAIAAISPAVACKAGEGWLAVQSTQKPDDPSLLALARSMCNKPA